MMLAAGTLLVLLGLVGAVYGIYALVRGRRNQGGGGLEPITERHPRGGGHQDADRRWHACPSVTPRVRWGTRSWVWASRRYWWAGVRLHALHAADLGHRGRARG
jgi:hypothetical protein